MKYKKETLESIAVYTTIIALILTIFMLHSGRYHFVNSDIVWYEKMIQVFKGHGDLTDIRTAFRYRLVCPALASMLPFAPLYSFRLVNLVFAIFTGVILIRYLKELGFKNQSVLLGGSIFFFSTPYVIWGTQPLTDMSGLFFIVLILYGLVRKWNGLLILLIISVGALTRETLLFMIFSFYLVFFQRVEGYRVRAQKTVIVLSGLIPIAVEFIVRYFINSGSTSSVSGSIPIPHMYFLLHNLDLGLTREFYIALLVFLPFFYFSFIKQGHYHQKDEVRRFVRDTSVGPLLMILYVFVAGWLDGRQVWVLYPVLIPLALFEYERFRVKPMITGKAKE